MIRLPYKKLESQVTRACKGSFGEMLASYPDEHWYTFALTTNDAIHALYPCANTEEDLDSTVKHYQVTVDKKFGCHSTHNGMRWSFGDWAVHDIGVNYFNDTNDTLRSITDALDNVDSTTASDCRSRMWESVIRGFNQLNIEEFFGIGAARERITLLIVGDLPRELREKCAMKLNPRSVATRYIEWNPNT